MHLLNKNNKLIDTFLFFAAGTLFAWGITASVLSCTEFSPDYKLLLLQTFIIMLLLRVVTLNKYILITVLIISAMTCIFIFYDMKTSLYLSEIYNNVKHSMKMLYRYITGFETYKTEYETIITWVFLSAVSIFTAVFVIGAFRFYVLFTVSIVIMGACLSSGDLRYNPSFIACMAGIFIFFVKHLSNRNMNDNIKITKLVKNDEIIPKSIEKSIEASKLTNNRKVYNLITVYSIPVVFICLTVAYFLPKPQNKTVEQTLNSIVKKPFDVVSDYFYPFFSSKYYSLKNTGFMNKNNKLGGNISLNDRVVMEVALSNNVKEKLYLVGAYKDKYTGCSWEDTELNYESYSLPDNSYSVDLLELSFSNLLFSYDTGEFDGLAPALENAELIKNTVYKDRCDYTPNGTLTIEMQLSIYKPKIATITMKDAKTFSIFAPHLTASIKNQENNIQLKKSTIGNLISNNLINTNEPYEITYRTKALINYWANIITCSRKGVYNELYEKLISLHEMYNFDKNQLSVNLDEKLDTEPSNLQMMNIYPEGEEYFNTDKSICYEDFLVDVLIPRAEKIYERYTVLPKHLPNRVIKLSEDITESVKQPYMKATMIQNFLKNIPYTLSPGEVPANRDFVDYFLFDGQKGYCVYYASAFVVMCRAVGIPARYVEGYVTPSEINKNGAYTVTNKQAHAWAEIYLEGYGWFTFDPTASTWYNEASSSSLTFSENYPDESDVTIDFKELEVIEVDKLNEITLEDEVSKEEMPSDEISKDEESIDEVFIKGVSGDINLSKAILKRIETPSELIIYRLLTSILLLILVLIIVISIRYYIKKTAITNKIKINNNEAAKQYFLIIIKYIKLLGFKQHEQETSMEFADRIKNEPSLSGNNIDFYTITDIFSKAYYGGKQISVIETSVLEDALYNMQKLILNKHGRIKYTYIKYVKIKA